MGGKERIPGIRIIMEYFPIRGPNGVNFVQAAARFVAERGIPSADFISNPFIREKIMQAQEMGIFMPSMFGNLSAIIREKESMTWTAYYPFQRFMDNQVMFKKGEGIAQVLELVFLRNLRKKFPNLATVNHGAMLETRRKQIAKRHGKEIQETGFEAEFKALKVKVRKNHLENIRARRLFQKHL